jgi:hypothetical protein
MIFQPERSIQFKKILQMPCLCSHSMSGYLYTAKISQEMNGAFSDGIVTLKHILSLQVESGEVLCRHTKKELRTRTQVGWDFRLIDWFTPR